jgi:hypothetical protein
MPLVTEAFTYTLGYSIVMSSEAVETPKVFTSYSHTTTEYSEWVRKLVDRLRDDGVDMILDVYRLKEGHDKYVFMEQMVTNTEVSKVLVICDRRYAEKADAREGGVGTESIIISREVYEKVDQEKFIPVVTELDEEGKPYLPAFLKGRMYIDLSSDEKLAENYEKLLRAIFGKPMHVEPAVGRPPSFLTEEGRVSTRTGFKLQMIKDAVYKDKTTAKGLIIDYLRAFTEAAEEFRFKTEEYEGIWGNKVKASIHRFLPYRDEFVEFISFVSLYVNDPAVYQAVFEFFERLLPYKDPPPLTSGFDNLGDNFRFILRELFLYTIAALIRNGKFEIADLFLRQEYFNVASQRADENDERHVTFTAFSTDARSIELDRFGETTGEIGKLLRERASHKELSFERLMEVELVLFLRSILHQKEFDWFWPPRTLTGARYHASFTLFAKAESHRGFDELKVLLGVESKQDLEEKLDAATKGEDFRASGYSVKTIKRLMNFEKLDSRP